jgi:hypothetical protein
MRLLIKPKTAEAEELCRFWKFRGQPLSLSFWAARLTDAALLKATHRRAGHRQPESDPIPNMR